MYSRTTPALPGQVCLDDELFLGLRLGYGEAFLKITRQCNNRCRFCCDRTFQDGHIFPTAQAIGLLEEGRRRGLESVVFSGGEPTLHPDLLPLLESAGRLGYRRITVITNGRYFAYREACRRAVRAGMTTAAVTLLSDRPEIHDHLCGVPGAFAQSLRAVRNLVALDPSLASVVITVTRPVVEDLPRILRFLHRLGVGGAALHRVAPLPYVPADPAVFFAPEIARRPLREAVALAESLGLPLAVKNFPPAFLEGYEHLITETEEFFPEVRDSEKRVGLFRSLVAPGARPLCADLDCATCYRHPFCDGLRELARRWRTGEGELLRVAPDRCSAAALRRVSQSAQPLALQGEDAAALARFAKERGWEARVTDLELERAPEPDLLAALPRLRTLWVRRAEGLDVSVAARPARAHVLRVNRHTAGWIAAHLALLRAEREDLALTPDAHERLREVRAEQVDLSAFFRPLDVSGIAMVGMPHCLAPTASHRRGPRVLDATVFDAEGEIDPLEACHVFLRDGWRDYRSRCARCPQREGCPGLPVGTLTTFGYRQLRPPGRG